MKPIRLKKISDSLIKLRVRFKKQLKTQEGDQLLFGS